MFGKLMSVSDQLMWRYLDLLSFRSSEEIAGARAAVAAGANPRDIKFDLAAEIVARFHSEAAAAQAREDFVQRFQQRQIPDDMPEFELGAAGEGLAIANVLKQTGLTASTSEAHRMVKQGAVKVDGERVEDGRTEIAAGSTHVVQVGKRRFARVTVGA
jgi:tyrosyl-tRNA synthetase